MLCVWVQVPMCSPSCGAEGAAAMSTPELLPHPAQGSAPHVPMCTLRSFTLPVPPCALGHRLLLLGMLWGEAWECPNKVTPPPPAPRHVPGVSLSLPGY